jgi:DNA-binding transcriptional LysR family regulator
MDTLDNLRAFLQSARLGSFSAAARHLGTTPSVIAKRIDQIEHKLGYALFRRSTRRLDLTEDGARLLPRCTRVIADFDDMVGDRYRPRGFAGRVQVRIAGPAAPMLLAPLLCDFQASHPALELDVRQTDHLLNPLDDGCDIAIGMRSVAYEGVTEIPLTPYPRVACASPDYLKRQGVPRHPHELTMHDCIVSSSTGPSWRFWGQTGEIAVDVHPRLMANSSIIQRDAAIAGLGVAILPGFLAEEELKAGRLVKLLEDHAPMLVWLKALVPETKLRMPVLEAVLAYTADRLQNMPAFRTGDRL